MLDFAALPEAFVVDNPAEAAAAATDGHARYGSEPFSFRDVVTHANDVVIVTEAASGAIVYVNPAFTALTRYSAGEALGKSPGKLLQGPATDPETIKNIHDALASRQGIRTEILNYDREGRAYWLDINIVPLVTPEGQVHHFAAVERDVTHQRRDKDRLMVLASTDPLTGLANLRGFTEFMNREVLKALRDSTCLTVIAFDVDHFKVVNDLYGHDEGDRVLRTIADRCAPLLRPLDLIARTGGEEFHVLLPHTPLCQGVMVAERLRLALAESPMTSRAAAVPITASFGVTRVSAPCGDGKESLVHADQLMYRAKSMGRNRVCWEDAP